MDGQTSVSPAPAPADPWVSERTAYDFAVAGNKSLVQAMLSIVRNPRYDVNKDKASQHGRATANRGPTLLHVFARNGWLDLVVDFVGKRGIHPDETPADGPWFTPLYHAVAAGHMEVAAFLLARGADVTRRGFPFGMLHALADLRGEKFDSGLQLILAAAAKRFGDAGGSICWTVWNAAQWFAGVAAGFPGKIRAQQPFFQSFVDDPRSALVNSAKVRKDVFDKFAELMWDISGSLEPPMNLAAKAGSVRGVLLFAAVGLHDGILEYGPTGRTALMEACAALEHADPPQAQRLLTVAKALLTLTRADPRKRVSASRCGGAKRDVGKTALVFAAKVGPAGVPMVNLLLAHGAGPLCPVADNGNLRAVGNAHHQLRGVFPRYYPEANGDLTKMLQDDKGKTTIRPNASQLG